MTRSPTSGVVEAESPVNELGGSLLDKIKSAIKAVVKSNNRRS